MIAAVVTEAMQRSRGEAMVSLSREGGRLRLMGLRQQGSAKCILPAGTRPDVPEIVFLNTSGGLAGGDALSYSATLGAGVRATATTQTAERAYRAADGVARVRVGLTVGAGGWLDWLPQETILFDKSRLDRRTMIDLAGDAGCLMLESVVLGRAAMGEAVKTLSFRDWREVRRDGAPVLVEPLRLTDGALATGTAGLAGARAFATLAMIGHGVADLLAPLRRLLDEPGVTGGASALDGRLVLRLMAVDGWPLRRQIARCLGLMRRGAALPRVWQM